MVDDDIFNIMAQKQVLKQAESNLLKKMYLEKYGVELRDHDLPEDSKLLDLVDTRNNG